MGEVWKVVPSRPEFLVSSEGRFMVAPYLAPMPRGGERQYGGEPHFGVWNKQDGRFIVVNKGKTYKVSRLVCEAFHGAAPSDDNICIHIDENASNNRPSNLKWGTQKENLNGKNFIAGCEHRTGEQNPFIKGRLAVSEMESKNGL